MNLGYKRSAHILESQFLLKIEEFLQGVLLMFTSVCPGQRPGIFIGEVAESRWCGKLKNEAKDKKKKKKIHTSDDG